MKSIGVLIVGLVAAVYLLNPGAGFIELIPDNIPIVGNLDEAGAVLLLLQCLGYFGIGLRRPEREKDASDSDEPRQ